LHLAEAGVEIDRFRAKMSPRLHGGEQSSLS